MGEGKKQMKIDKKHLAKELRSEAVKTFSALLASAFGLIAALAWNEAVKEAIDRYIAPGEGLKSKLIYAVFVTLLAIAISYQMGKLAAHYKVEEDLEEEKEKEETK